MGFKLTFCIITDTDGYFFAYIIRRLMCNCIQWYSGKNTELAKYIYILHITYIKYSITVAAVGVRGLGKV